MSLDQATKQHLEKELLPFLTLDARIDVKSIAIRYFLEMTGSKEGRDFIAQGDKYLKAIMELTSDQQMDVTKDSFLALINLTSEQTVAWRVMNDHSIFVLDLLQRLLNPDFKFADEASSIVANVTRLPACASKLADEILAENSKVSMASVVNALCKMNFNKNATLHYLGVILSNLTQVPAVRKAVMDKNQCIIQKLLPFTEYKESLIRRGGIIGALKNCCFEYEYHPWLLGEDVDILPRLLLPLAGGEEFDEDDTERLPLDLQYLPPEKTRESDADIRTSLIEAITQLCCTKEGRTRVKEKNAYVILRELHKWEKDPQAKLVCHQLCELLVSDEPEPGMEDLHKVDVPEHLLEKFKKMDEQLYQDIVEDLQDKEKEDQGAEDKTQKQQE